MDFRALPKIELHAHLSGSISRQCLHDVWVKKKERGETELEDPLIVMPEGKFDYDLDTFFPLFSKYIYSLCNDRESVIQTTNSVLRDFADDGVVYLELRTTPRAIPSENLTQEDYILTILSCITHFNTTSPQMKTNLILSIDRRHTLDTALSIVNLAAKHRSKGIVGIDLCGNPLVGDVSLFATAFSLAHNHSLPITIHFAEAPTTTTPSELRDLLSYHPSRIGHVISVPDDVKEEIVKRGLGLELCLSCNVHAKMLPGGKGSFGDHHFGWWREFGGGCKVVLCTDDVGVFGSSLSNEYRLIAEHFHLDRREMVDLARGAIDVIFGSEEDKEKLREVMWKE